MKSNYRKCFYTVVMTVSLLCGLACSGGQSGEIAGEQKPVESGRIPLQDEFVQVDVYPEMIYEETPMYPTAAKQAGIEGTVWVKAMVDESGNVQDALSSKSSGDQSLDDAAVTAAHKCRYKPAMAGDKPVKVWVTYKVDFRLGDAK